MTCRTVRYAAAGRNSMPPQRIATGLSLGRFRGYRRDGRSIGLNYLIPVNSSFTAVA
jgi:hypothetical protein